MLYLQMVSPRFGFKDTQIGLILNTDITDNQYEWENTYFDRSVE